MISKKLLSVFTAVLFVSGVSVLAYRNGASSALNQEVSSMASLVPSSANHGNHNHHSLVANASSMNMSRVQDQEPAPPVEDDSRCERPDPNGKDPDKGGTDPKKIGCNCKRTCAPDGQTIIESPKQDERCKKHCKKDHCDCPNPCKS